jgi:hypothetical protein
LIIDTRFDNMSGAQRAVLLIGAAIVLLMLLFPPWSEAYSLHSEQGTRFAGFHLIFRPEGASSISAGQLLLQIVGVVVAAAFAHRALEPKQ